MENKFILGDCMDPENGLPSYPDGYFDLAIVDPPYGIGENWKKDRASKFYTHNSTYKNNSIPGNEYFLELFRVSKNQIVWGGNYYTDFLSPRNSWIVWDKKRDFEKQHMAEGELAWTSFNVPLRIAPAMWNGCCRCEDRYGVHPHEKPISLYKWQLAKYAKPGNLILDTHVDSASSLIACESMGFNYVGYEIDPDYYAAAKNRMNKGIQAAMF